MNSRTFLLCVTSLALVSHTESEMLSNDVGCRLQTELTASENKHVSPYQMKVSVAGVANDDADGRS